MTDLFESVLEFSYLGIFFLLILVNAAPLLMPPTWIILASFYAIDASYDPLVLALVGATGATIGRFILKQVSSIFRKFIQKEQKSNLDAIGNFLTKKDLVISLHHFFSLQLLYQVTCYLSHTVFLRQKVLDCMLDFGLAV